RTAGSVWDFGDGVTVTNQPFTSHAWTALGDYTVVLRAYNESNPGGISASIIIHVIAPPVHYVAAGNTNPVAPYTSWATAATSIQAAVNAVTLPGSLVVVTNGVYGSVTIGNGNRISVSSVNGSQVTTITGGGSRCATLGADASLSGFTLANGRATYALTNGTTSFYGGGVMGGTLNNCILTGNVAEAPVSTYSYCIREDEYGCIWYGYISSVGAAYGGGAAYSTLNNCTLSGNAVRAPL